MNLENKNARRMRRALERGGNAPVFDHGRETHPTGDREASFPRIPGTYAWSRSRSCINPETRHRPRRPESNIGE